MDAAARSGSWLELSTFVVTNQVLARDARCLERCPDLGLVAVHLGGVDVAVPDLEGLAHRVVGVLGRDLVGTESENGDGGAVGSARVGIGDEAGAGSAGSGVFIGESS